MDMGELTLEIRYKSDVNYTTTKHYDIWVCLKLYTAPNMVILMGKNEWLRSG